MQPNFSNLFASQISTNYFFPRTKMQNLSVVESLADTDISHCEPPKDLAAEAGGVSLGGSGCNCNERTSNEEIVNLEAMQQSLPVMNSKGRSCEGFSESSFSTSEPSGSWGDFEGFQEPLDKAEFSCNLEVLVKSAKASGGDVSSGGCSISAAQVCAEPSPCPGMQEASGSLNEVRAHSKPRTTNVGVTASFTCGFVSVFSAEGNAAHAESCPATSGGTKAPSLQCLTNAQAVLLESFKECNALFCF